MPLELHTFFTYIRGIRLRPPPLRIGTFCSQHVLLITKWRSAADYGYNHARPVTFLGLYSVYLMKYAGKHFLEQSGRFGNVVLKTPTPVHKTPTVLSPLPHEGTRRTPWNKTTSGPYRDMGGRLGNTCLVHAKSEGGVIGKIGVGFLGTWENIRPWSFPEKTSCQACHIHAKNTQERCLCKALQSYLCYLS